MLNTARQKLKAALISSHSHRQQLCLSQYAAYSSRSTASPFASTSRLTLDHPHPSPTHSAEPPLPIQKLLPDGQRFPIKRAPKRFLRRNKRTAVGALLPKLTIRASVQPNPQPHPKRRQPFDRSRLTPNLPLVTRERNKIVSEFKRALRSPTRSPESVWTALVPLLSYPTQLPALPLAFHASSTRSPVDEDGSAEHEPRTAVPLGLDELRRAFTVLASARPRTREGLARLLVVVELIAQRAPQQHTQPASSGGGVHRDQLVGELRAGGFGLREKDWASLMLFAATSFRSPRPTHEVADAFNLFAQYERQQQQQHHSSAGALGGGAGSTTSNQTMFNRRRKKRFAGPGAGVFNALLRTAAKSRSWALFELTERRMQKEGVKPDAYTIGTRLEKEARRGAPIEVLWGVLEEALGRFEGGGETGPLWNMLLWAMVRREDFGPAKVLYDAMESRTRIALVDLVDLEPATSPGPKSLFGFLTDEPAPNTDTAPSPTHLPPRPSTPTYSMLVQAYAHQGDLRACLSIVRDYVRTPESGGQPTMAMFASIFRAFATHGEPPRNHASSLVDPHLLEGKRQRTNALAAAETARPLRALERLSSLHVKGAVVARESGETSNGWTLNALKSLLQSFLSLQPPTPPSLTTQPTKTALPHEGTRTAPQSEDIFWLLLAIERLTGGDSMAVLDAFHAVKRVYGEGGRAGDGVRGWRGWRVGRRLRDVVEKHRERVRERQVEAGEGKE